MTVSMNISGPISVHSGQGPWGFPPGGSGNGGGRPPPPPGGGGPWGGGPGGPRPGGPRPGGPGPLPDIDMLVARLQAAVRRMLGGGGGGGGGPGMRFTGGRPLAMLAMGIVLLWCASGFYRVQPDELGIVLRFGAYSYRTEPGLHWHLPWPVEKVLLPAVTRINRTEIGYRSGANQSSGSASGVQDVPSESEMLTGDENIIDINLAAFWKISNAEDYLFNVRDPDHLVKAVAESSIREVIGRTPIQPALTQLRAQIEHDVRTQVQQILTHYSTGIEITQVQLQRVDPPPAVIESFRDVQRANTDAERVRNEAEAYCRRHRAARPRRRRRHRFRRPRRQAGGYRAGDRPGAAFDSVFKAYQAAKDVTLRRRTTSTPWKTCWRMPSLLVVDDKRPRRRRSYH